MKTTITTTAALALLFCLTAAGLCRAQQPNSEDFYSQPEPQSLPEPHNPVSKSLDSGRLMIVVGAERSFAYRIGELIPVTVVISADPSVQVNIEALKRGTLSSQPSDFELAAPPEIISERKNGKEIRRLQLLLRSWVVKPVLVLNCEFHYAVELLPDGKTPNWKPVSTPDFVLQRSATSTDAAKNLLEGDMNSKESPAPPLLKAFRIGGWLLFSCFPAWLMARLWRRRRPARPLTAAERAWLVFEPAFEQVGRRGSLSYDNLSALAGALREFLHVESVPLRELAAPLDRFFSGYDNKSEMITLTVSALSKLDRALYARRKLTRSEESALIAELERIVPRA